MFQTMTDRPKDKKQLIRVFTDDSEKIEQLVQDLKEKGYEIIDFPEIEKTRRVYHVNLHVIIP
jgi:ABC-type lipoprotein release transport system permease subunit